MEHTRKPAEANGLPLRGPHWQRGSPEGAPAPLLPLRLVNQQGGMIIRITQPEVVVGRHSQVDVRLPMPDVSRRHCRLVYANGTWQVFDLKSLNGVFVNGQRVESAVLGHGDVLSIGGFTFDVNLASEPAVSAPATESQPSSPDGVWHSIAEALPRPAPDTGYEQRRAC